MKYIFKNLIIYQFTLACSFLLGQSKAFKYNLFPGTPELKDVFITEEQNSNSMELQFTGTNFDYIKSENFAPPSITLSFKNLDWTKGNFVKKCNQEPLYQYSINIPRNSNQKEIDKRLILKLDFTRIPDYKIKICRL